MDRAQQIARFKRLTETTLPALAREHHWPIRLDHCFKRICLDHAFADVWYRHLKKPAERHLAGDPLLRALACAEDLTRQGLPLLQLRNQASLTYRANAALSKPVASPPPPQLPALFCQAQNLLISSKLFIRNGLNASETWHTSSRNALE